MHGGTPVMGRRLQRAPIHVALGSGAVVDEKETGMGFRMRKSIKLGPGVRVNVSHRGAVPLGGSPQMTSIGSTDEKAAPSHPTTRRTGGGWTAS